ncbi:hypothetical protein BDF20DRAFT_849116 [Mycotypha africana]|uniref:uncharacterized protein n=1 Tax=Mycotypha africana TaxID=64632 RepID=UPI002301D718|nr:uncharacterized protein BDF20DRAFT_849116 [Mycotypha africana]KAI8987259.1 hypothetical protein BDF20DRAFT_849116 [Mycotypha africana]
MIIKYVFATLSLCLITLSEAYFYVPDFMANLPFKGGMSAAQKDKSLILFGGENATTTYTNDLYQLTRVADTFTWQTLSQQNAPPGNVYGQAIITKDNKNMFLMGGMTNTTNNQIIPLQYYQYSFDSSSWSPAITNGNTSIDPKGIPLNRKLFSATYDGSSKVYIYGGALNETAIFSDFWMMDLNTKKFTPLPSPNIPRYAHTASYLSNGQLVIIGGVAQVNQSGQIGNILAPMNQIYVYDTKSNQWDLKVANGTNKVLPSTRTAHNAIVTEDDRIIIFGGDNGAAQRGRAYLNAVGILDTKTWTWTTPAVKGIPPSRRSYASAGLIDNRYLTVAFGSSLNSYYNDVNVFDIEKKAWLQSFEPQVRERHRKLSGGVIAGIVIACVVLAVIFIFLIWRFQGFFGWLIKRIHRDIWQPRTGEPMWAETARIIFQIILLFIFAVFLAFVIRQAIHSPHVTQTIEESVAEVQVPDVRFCFDGYPEYSTQDMRSVGVTCQTDNGYSCSKFIQPLNMSVFQPTFADNLGSVHCYLFRAPNDFVLTSTSGANNGSRLIFTFWGDQSINYGRVHTSVYPKTMDPNSVIYGINDGLPTLMAESEVLNWQVNERNDIQATNVFTVEPFTYSALAYNLIEHRYLQEVSWNYVGFLPIFNITPEIETYFRQEAENPNYANTHQDLGVMAVFPNRFITTVEREVKMYTLVNALGFVGGIFGLLVAVQTWLFGYRPRSPWGVIQRWSVGDMKRSLLRGLQSKFKISESGVPLVHPVHHRFSVTNINNASEYNEPETQRINRVEERMQMLEMLFKAYYVDDEVFRSLDDANRAEHYNNNNQRGGNSYPPPSFKNDVAPRSEKMTAEDTYSTTTSATILNRAAPPSFSRCDTGDSSASHNPLTQHYQHAPPYQPSTNFQMKDF